jgi:hypothetical protein
MRMIFTRLKIAVFRPIPRAREETATSVKPGDFERVLPAYRKS